MTVRRVRQRMATLVRVSGYQYYCLLVGSSTEASGNEVSVRGTGTLPGARDWVRVAAAEGTATVLLLQGRQRNGMDTSTRTRRSTEYLVVVM